MTTCTWCDAPAEAGRDYCAECFEDVVGQCRRARLAAERMRPLVVAA